MMSHRSKRAGGESTKGVSEGWESRAVVTKGDSGEEELRRCEERRGRNSGGTTAEMLRGEISSALLSSPEDATRGTYFIGCDAEVLTGTPLIVLIPGSNPFAPTVGTETALTTTGAAASRPCLMTGLAISDLSASVNASASLFSLTPIASSVVREGGVETTESSPMRMREGVRVVAGRGEAGGVEVRERLGTDCVPVQSVRPGMGIGVEGRRMREWEMGGWLLGLAGSGCRGRARVRGGVDCERWRTTGRVGGGGGFA